VRLTEAPGDRLLPKTYWSIWQIYLPLKRGHENLEGIRNGPILAYFSSQGLEMWARKVHHTSNGVLDSNTGNNITIPHTKTKIQDKNHAVIISTQPYKFPLFFYKKSSTSKITLGSLTKTPTSLSRQTPPLDHQTLYP
jgi:hypothetical protein